MKPHIVILDGELANPGDLSWDHLDALGKLTVYDSTPAEKVIERGEDADILIVNKVKLGQDQLEQLSSLKLICLLATGYNNIDIDAARKYGITVCNAVGYADASVAQHVFAMILSIYNRVSEHNQSVQKGEWSSKQWSFSLYPLCSLNRKTIGIYGFGKIGQKVAEIAKGFDMKILSHHKHPKRDATPGVRFVSLEELFEFSDIVTLHAPLTEENYQVVNQQLLALMKPDAILVNTGRGGLIHEKDLHYHLKSRRDHYALLDVLSEEPPPEDHVLIGLDNCIITPHNAWASKEARKRLLDIVADNVAAYLEGSPINTV